MPFKKFVSILVVAQTLNVAAVQADENEQAIVPDNISNIYSDVDMRVRLATKPNAVPCEAENCNLQQEFDARVQQLGAQLSAAAFLVYPTLNKHVHQFVFSVVDKKDPGIASNGAGKIVLFRGLQQLELTDDALSFIIAREMGHVIGKHHTKNTSIKLIISALASIAFPALAVISASSAAAQATTATTLISSAASTATSMVGSEVALAKMKPDQLAESDEIALKLLRNQDWDMRSVANILQFDNDQSENAWIKDLQVSGDSLQKIVDQEELALLPTVEESLSAKEVNITTSSAELSQ
ncbi:MAG: M48 family metalloprotease [Methylotenera sp.]